MKKIGFFGLGTMGLPMAVNIAAAGIPLTVYNRTQGRAAKLLTAGASEAPTPAALIGRVDVVLLMLSGPAAIDAVLAPETVGPADALEGKIVVNLGTNPPGFSRQLEARLERSGASFVDAPVSGTETQAENGDLVIMASGPGAALAPLSGVFEAVGSRVIQCGRVPRSAMMKLANNIVLSASLAGLIEGLHFAEKAGIDAGAFLQLLLDGPLGNDMFRIKARKILAQDFSPQASIRVVREMLKHIIDAAHEMDAFIPGTLSNANLVTAAMNRGLADEDACAILKVYRQEKQPFRTG